MNAQTVVSADEWQQARDALLVKEKEHTRARDALAAERRRMPWTSVDKEYAFEGPDGPATLLDLFEGRRQLIVYRFFYEDDVDGCRSTAAGVLLPCRPGGPRRAPERARHHARVRLARPAGGHRAWKARMGWEMPWYTITDDFDSDFGVREWHGTNAFIRDGDQVFRTYFIDSRGDEAMGSTWSYLDITALGRQEEWEDSPEGYPQTAPYQWWRLHDEYERAAAR